MPTKQETFDTVVSHLRKQGKKSLDGSMCCYRSPDGLSCAAGCLIPDDRYKRSFEGDGVRGKPKSLFIELGHDLSLLEDLQSVHDMCDVCYWEEEFSETALAHGILYTQPEAAQ